MSLRILGEKYRATGAANMKLALKNRKTAKQRKVSELQRLRE